MAREGRKQCPAFYFAGSSVAEGRAAVGAGAGAGGCDGQKTQPVEPETNTECGN